MKKTVMKSKLKVVFVVLSLTLTVFFVQSHTGGLQMSFALAADKDAQQLAPAKCPNPAEIKVDVATSALLMLHWQNDLIRFPEGKLSKPWGKRIQDDKTIDHAKAALEAARKAGMFVVFVNIGFQKGYPEVPPKKYLKGFIKDIVEGEMNKQGTWGTAVIDEFKRRDDEPLVWNYTASAFEATQLNRILTNRGIKNLYLSGVATNYVVENTMRAGRDIGYANTILMDCCNSSSQDIHCWPLANTMGHMAVVSNSANFIKALEN